MQIFNRDTKLDSSIIHRNEFLCSRADAKLVPNAETFWTM